MEHHQLSTAGFVHLPLKLLISTCGNPCARRRSLTSATESLSILLAVTNNNRITVTSLDIITAESLLQLKLAWSGRTDLNTLLASPQQRSAFGMRATEFEYLINAHQLMRSWAVRVPTMDGTNQVYCCSMCNFQCFNNRLLLKHIKSAHENDPRFLVYCSICGKSMRKWSYLTYLTL